MKCSRAYENYLCRGPISGYFVNLPDHGQRSKLGPILFVCEWHFNMHYHEGTRSMNAIIKMTLEESITAEVMEI